MFHGPQELGVTGDNSFHTLFGRLWAFLHCDDDQWFLLQWQDDEHLDPAEGLESPGWLVVEEPLLDLGELECGVTRRVTAAFDQSARLVVAFENPPNVRVTRWDTELDEYVQNVTLAGVDPALFMDATVANPLGWPEDAQVAVAAGIPVLIEWLKSGVGVWLLSPIPDSDVVLFYLSADRERVLARVQRDVFGIEHEVFDFGTPVVLDRAMGADGRYQLLVSDAEGAKLADGLLSAAYVGGLIVNPRVRDALDVSAVPVVGEHRADWWQYAAREGLSVSAEPAAAAHTRMLKVIAAIEGLSVDAVVSEGRYQAEYVVRDDREALDVSVGVEVAKYDHQFQSSAAREGLVVAAAVATARYKEAS